MSSQDKYYYSPQDKYNYNIDYSNHNIHYIYSLTKYPILEYDYVKYSWYVYYNFTIHYYNSFEEARTIYNEILNSFSIKKQFNNYSK